MAQVNVTINGHQYRMACLDGQEDHLLGLARGFSERIEGMRAQFGEVGDMRLTIMAAVTVADELSEAAAKIRRLEQQITSAEQARLVAAERAQVTQAAVAAAFASAAERIETVARNLSADSTRPDGGAARASALD
ncbi:MAG: cell division protein ZapA [Xanthobacteraceae bacterium]|jgi:cell division protein ZapA